MERRTSSWWARRACPWGRALSSEGSRASPGGRRRIEAEPEIREPPERLRVPGRRRARLHLRGEDPEESGRVHLRHLIRRRRLHVDERIDDRARGGAWGEPQTRRGVSV